MDLLSTFIVSFVVINKISVKKKCSLFLYTCCLYIEMKNKLITFLGWVIILFNLVHLWETGWDTRCSRVAVVCGKTKIYAHRLPGTAHCSLSVAPVLHDALAVFGNC